jgi:hypothetical protein
MKHLVKSFQEHVGQRGVHFYDDSNCNFLMWDKVFDFINVLSEKRNTDQFSEKLADSLANYDPDVEFLAVQQMGDTVSVEIYSEAQ